MRTEPGQREDGPACTRCGECCLHSTPSLHLEDLALIEEGILPRFQLYTVRAGELVRDNVSVQMAFAEHELVKVREKEGNDPACVFYDEGGRACRIYDRRPLQCAALLCRDPSAFLEAYRRPKATRRHLFNAPALHRLMDEHEKRCGYPLLSAHVEEVRRRGRKAVEEILKILRFDHDLRPVAVERLGLDPRETDLLFGRPLIDTIVMFGLEVRREPDGAFFLTMLQRGRYRRGPKKKEG